MGVYMLKESCSPLCLPSIMFVENDNLKQLFELRLSTQTQGLRGGVWGELRSKSTQSCIYYVSKILSKFALLMDYVIILY